MAGYRFSISAFHDPIKGFQWINTLAFAFFLKRFLIKEHQFQDIRLYGTLKY